MSELSRSDKILAARTAVVLLIQGESPDGRPIYAYVGVRADRLQDIMQAQHQPHFQPEDYGVVIEHGEGLPSAEVMARMAQDYGFSHEAMTPVADADSANQVAAALSRKANLKDGEPQ